MSKIIKFFDAHAHLDEIPNLDDEIKKAKEANIIGIIAVGCEPESNQLIFQIAEKYKGYVYPSIGLHPWDLKGIEEIGLKYLRKYVAKAIAIGEVGLDYRIDLSKEIQIKVFKEVAKIAKEYEKPLIIHARDAWRDAFSIVKEVDVEKAIFHWYSGPLDLLKEILKEGYYISATPAVEYQKKHIDAVVETPIERIILESDCPVVYRGVESRPIDVIRSARGVAKVKNLPLEVVAEKTLINVSKIFNIELK